MPPPTRAFELSAQVYRIEDADAASEAGATEICFDPFLRHPAPPLARIRALQERLTRARRVAAPAHADDRSARKSVGAFRSGSTSASRFSAAISVSLPSWPRRAGTSSPTTRRTCSTPTPRRSSFGLGARRIVASVELTTDELSQLVAPWDGEGFDVFLYGRPEGMTIEHCVLSAAFDREPTTCRDLCVQKHTNVELTDPTGYTFPVATDSACRNRLLHSRPIDGAEFMPRLWRSGIRGYHMAFNVPGDDVSAIVRAYRGALDALATGARPDVDAVRRAVGPEYTRGHFARAV